MRAAATRLAIITAAAGFGLTSACPVAATGTASHPSRTAWFSTTLADQAGSPVTPPVSQPTGVPKGDDPVAYTAGQGGASSEETLLEFNLPGATAGAKITAFTVSMTLDSSPTAPQAAAQGAPIVACLPTRGWPAGEAQDSTQQPTVDCSHAVAGVWKSGTVTFAITRLAQSWVDDVNLGVALVNDPKNQTQPFQAVFGGGKQIAATMSFTAASKAPSTGTPPPAQHSQHPSSGQAPAPSSPSGGQPAATGNGSSIPSVTTPLTGSTATHSTGQAAGQPPVVANTTGNAAQPTAAQSVAHSSSLPSPGFWLAGGLLLIVLLAAALALDDRHAVTPERTGSSRLDRLLRDPTRLATFTTRSQP